MKIDLSQIIKCEGGNISFADAIRIAPLKLMGETIAFSDEVKIVGNIVNEGEIFRMQADIKGTMEVRCARCAKPLSREFSVPMSETLVQERDNTDSLHDEDVVVFSGSELEIDTLVENSIFLNLPIKYLCKEDCKGLCPRCGADLNEGNCGCSQKEIDPRLAVLSKLVEQ